LSPLFRQSLVRTQVVKRVIVVIDAGNTLEKEQYMEAVNNVYRRGLEVLVNVSNKRRGSTNAINKVLDLAEQTLNDNDVINDCMCLGNHAILPVLR